MKASVISINHDTAEFAVESIRKRLNFMGKKRYVVAKKLMITADGDESNGPRVKM